MSFSESMSKNITKSAVQTILTQIPTQLFGIVAGIFITRLLGAEGRGLYAIFYADVELFITVLGFSINTAIIYFIANGKIEKNKIVGLSVFSSFATVLLSSILILSWWMLPFSDWFFPKELMTAKYILLLILFIFISQVNTVYSSVLQGAREFGAVNKVLFFNSVYNILLFGGVFLYSKIVNKQIGLDEILLVALLVLFLNTFQWHREYKKRFKYEIDFKIKWKNDIYPFLKMTGIVHLSNVINFFNYRLVLWVLAYYLDNKQIGIFSLGVGLSQLLSFISTPLSQVLTPFLSADNKKGRLENFMRFARIHFSFISLSAVITFPFVPFMIPFLYGNEFVNSVMVYNILLFGIVLSCQSKIIASFLFSSGKANLNLWATIIGFVLTFSFNFTLVRMYGINGGATAQTLTYAGIFLFVYLSMLIITKFRFYNIFIARREDISYVRQQIGTKTKGN